ncbi:MAG: ABC transporter permease, partial [Acidobacteriaceae bacterium]|nr:ABC transporter permease [Acidobacteriaceae bacterium]
MRRAKAELGSIAAGKENCRQQWGTRWFDELHGDLRYGLRMLAKSPGFALIAIGSLALGIGANTAIFSIAKRVLLDRLNVPHAEQLRLLTWTSNPNSAVHSIWGDWNKGYDGVYSTSFSYPVYEVLRNSNRGLEDLFAFKDAGRMDATIDGQAEVVQSELVSGNYYEQMRVQPQLGRLITPQDDQTGAAPVAVISDEYWTRRFNRSPSVIGRTILLNLTPTTIVGVNPREFTGAQSVQSSPDIFAPIALEPLLVSLSWEGGLLEDANRWWLQVMARTKPGASEAAAQAQLSTTLHEAVVALMKPKSGDTVPRLLLTDGSRGMNEAGQQLKEPLLVLSALAGMVLVLACANLANLLLARSTARQREMSVRITLGARRGRIMRQMLTEALLLTVCGGALGLIVGYLGRNALLQLTADPSAEAAPLQAAFSWGVFAFNAGLSLATGILFGFAPAWRATRTNVQSSLKESAQTTTRRRHGYTGKAIVAFQIAVSMLLVAGAGVFLRTLINLYRVDPGFDTRNIVLFQLNPPKSRYPVEKQIALYGNIEKRLATIPGVEAVSAESIPLLANDRSNDDFVPTGMKRAKGEDQTELDNYVGDQYFATLRIPMLAGRTFTVHDTANSTRVAVVNEALAKKYWTVGSAIGKTFRTTDIKQNKLLYTIVGVCAN